MNRYELLPPTSFEMIVREEPTRLVVPTEVRVGDSTILVIPYSLSDFTTSGLFAVYQGLDGWSGRSCGKKEVVIGSAVSEDQIRLPRLTVAGTHGRITYGNGEYFIQSSGNNGIVTTVKDVMRVGLGLTRIGGEWREVDPEGCDVSFSRRSMGMDLRKDSGKMFLKVLGEKPEIEDTDVVTVDNDSGSMIKPLFEIQKIAAVMVGANRKLYVKSTLSSSLLTVSRRKKI